MPAILGERRAAAPVWPTTPAAASPPLRMALFTDTFDDVNGVARFVRSVAGVAARTPGAELHIVTCGEPACDPPAAAHVHRLPARLAVPLPGYRDLTLRWPDARAGERLLDALGPDAVHVSTPGPAGLLGRRLALRRGLPLLGTHHTDFPAYAERLLGSRALARVSALALRRFYRPFDAVFARSHASAAGTRALLGPRARVEIIPPGINVARFAAAKGADRLAVWAAHPGVRPAAVKALYVGRVSVEKGLPDLVRLWPAVSRAAASHGLDVQLVIVGDGPYRATMERALPPPLAAYLGFRPADELPRLYAGADLFVFPSTTDTLGQAVMEAQACGLPALVTDRGGPAETVADGETGFVLPPLDQPGAADRWIDAVLRLARDPALRERLGRAAGERLAPRTIERSFERFWALHAELVAARAKTKPARG